MNDMELPAITLVKHAEVVIFGILIFVVEILVKICTCNNFTYKN